MKITKQQVLYCSLQAAYWMLFCVVIGYANAYLTGIGISTFLIGIVVALGGLVSALTQPLLGKLADSHKFFSWDRQLMAYFLATAAIYGLLIVIKEPVICCLLIGLASLLSYQMMPFVNVIPAVYEKKAIALNFGVARGFGSMFYAVLSFFLGIWMSRFGALPLLISGSSISLLLFLILLFIKKDLAKQADQIKASEKGLKASSSSSQSWAAFISHNKAFCLILIGFVCYLTFHNISCTYMLQFVSEIGYGKEEMGIIYSIAGLIEIPIMFLFSYIVKKVSSHKLLVLVGISFCIKAVMYIFATNIYVFYTAQFFQMTSFGLYAAISVYYAFEVIPEAEITRGQALIGSATTLGGVIGNLLGGATIAALGTQPTLIIGLAIAALGTILVLLVGLFSKAKRRNSRD